MLSRLVYFRNIVSFHTLVKYMKVPKSSRIVKAVPHVVDRHQRKISSHAETDYEILGAILDQGLATN